ncbi:SAM-dependent methyltransferase [Hamadaea flava]|uniref:Class I SAM-dependent methyltransferase n=1 Tax=Hamadaea flava TaxID=1742688 RepID=A0ABV8LKV7_9ACTN|nr:methyltransferase domain-containing protein [Hamadaea flava]MCP2323556.1 SAM-dependent methyltransferase [Hamadaea flava]
MTTTYGSQDTELVGSQLAYLQACLDDNTRHQLDSAGLQPGWRCLEIGAGTGSIADHLHRTVGLSGYVLATDLRPDRIRADCDIICHDVIGDPVPHAGTWNLIHARLVEMQLPPRRKIVAKLADALAPGGTLLLESLDCRTPPALLQVPDGADATVWPRVIAAMLLQQERAGTDLSWAHSCRQAMREAGLFDVVAECFNRTWSGGTPGTLLHTINLHQLQDDLDGVPEHDRNRFRVIATHPDTVAWFYPVISTRGNRAWTNP